MSKYAPLTAGLSDHVGPEWRATFAEIEAMLGFTLPRGARSGRIWWANSGAMPHQRAWTGAGWEVAEVDQDAGLVTFRKIAPPPTPAPPSLAEPEVSPPAVADEPAILKRLEATPKWTFALVATGLTIAAGLSVFAIRGWMRRR
jgi:hypothetical protein